jgi:hypothetical protein
MSQATIKKQKKEEKMEIDEDSFNPNNPYEKIVIAYDNDDDIQCDICLEYDHEDDDQIVMCDLCNAATH